MKKRTLKLVSGIFFALVLVAVVYFCHNRFSGWGLVGVQLGELLLFSLSLSSFLPEHKRKQTEPMGDTEQKKLSKRSLFAIFIVLIIIPLTILAGVYCFGDKKYYFISLLIILEILLPFFILFEKKKPQARMLVLISVLCAVTVVGRIAFQWIPQFKPVLALVIIMGVAFGGETGFLTGAVTAFVSNFYFIQGAWTPWQMFCFGIVGFAAGVFYQKGFLKVNRLSLTIFGGLSTLVLYGGIMNPASILMFQPKPTLSMLIASYGMGFSFDLIHAGATMFFLWFASEPMLGKLERMKLKYGISFR